MLLAVIYVRYSSTMQDENSIELQLHEIHKYARENGIAIVGEPYADRGESGRTASNRDSFEAMCEDLLSGRVQAKFILIYKMSRFLRDVPRWSMYELRLRQRGIEVISVTEPLPDDKRLRNMNKNMIRMFDQFTSETIGQLSLDGTKQIVRAGYWSGGPAPFGYANQKIPNREGHLRKKEVVMRGTLVPHRIESNVVIRVFEIAAATGKGACLILKQMTEECGGIQPLGRNGKPLDATAVNRILANQIYKGCFVYNRHENEIFVDENGRDKVARRKKDPSEWVMHQNEEWRLVSDEIWEQAQQARAENRRQRGDFGGGPQQAAYAMTGMIICGHCGGSCGGKWQHSRFSNYYYYRCRNAMNGSLVCPNKSKVRGEDLERALIQKIVTEVMDENLIEEIAADTLAALQNLNAPDLRQIEGRLKDVCGEIERLTSLAAKIGGSIDEIADRLRALESERQVLRSTLESNPDLSLPSLDDLRAHVRMAIKDARAVFATPSGVDDLRIALSEWIEQVRVDLDGAVFVKWRETKTLDLLRLPEKTLQILGKDDKAAPVSTDGVTGTLHSAGGHRLFQFLDWQHVNISGSATTVTVNAKQGSVKVTGFNCAIASAKPADQVQPSLQALPKGE